VLSGALESSSVADGDLKISDGDVNNQQTSEDLVTNGAQGAASSSPVRVVVDDVDRVERSLAADSVDEQFSSETETLMRLKDIEDDKDVMSVTDKNQQSASYAMSVSDISA